MTSLPGAPDGADLAALRAEIDALKAIPEDELIDPAPGGLLAGALEAEPTDAMGTEKWDRPVSDESLEQE